MAVFCLLNTLGRLCRDRVKLVYVDLERHLSICCIDFDRITNRYDFDFVNLQEALFS